MVLRYAIGVALGAIVTFGLLTLMRAVIGNPTAAAEADFEGSIVELVRVQEDREVKSTRVTPKPPPPPDEQPPRPPAPPFEPSDATVGPEVIDIVIDDQLELGRTGGFISDGDYLPIVKVRPPYPRRALSRGIEGHVLLQFTVTDTGSVRDPVIVEAKPPGIFDRAAISAVLKYKYRPKVVNGEPIEVSGVMNLIKFEIEDDDD